MNPNVNETVGRCSWCESDPLYQAYHDTEWGRIVTRDHKLLESICLEGAQAGLSWLIVLKKRPQYRESFKDFHPEKVARMTPEDIQACMSNPGLIRHRKKLESIPHNARQFLKIQNTRGSFFNYVWEFVDGQQIQNHWRTADQIPSSTPISAKISKDLKQHGFKFVGATIIYSFMQAVGMVNDHLISCHCWSLCNEPRV